MKTKPSITIRAGDLKPVLTGLGKVVPRRADLSAIQCLKVEAHNRSHLRLTATDLDLTLTMDLPASLSGTNEPFLLPLAQLREQTRKAKVDDPVTLHPSAKAPELKEFPQGNPFRAAPQELDKRVTRNLIRAFRCASHDDTRYILQGALLDVSGKGKDAHRIVATNGRALYQSNSMQLPQLKKSIILPDHKLWQWKLLAESHPWTLRVGTTSKAGVTPFRINGPFWTLTGRTIEGNYPSYQQVIPPASEFKTSMTLPEKVREAMIGLLPKLPGKKIDNRPVGIHIEKGLVSLLARDSLQEPWQFYPIGKARHEGKDNLLFANRDYVLRSLQFGLDTLSLVDEQVAMKFSRGGDLMIVMPVRATDTEGISLPKGVKPIVSETASAGAPPKKAVSPASKKRKKRCPAKPDPIQDVETRIAEANESLATIGKQLSSASGSLKTARKNRSRDRKELKGFRSLFRSIREFTGGSN